MEHLFAVPDSPEGFDYGLTIARNYLAKLEVDVDLSAYPELEPGVCDDCEKTWQAEHGEGVEHEPELHRDRWHHGSLNLCRRCLLKRTKTSVPDIVQTHPATHGPTVDTRRAYVGMLLHWLTVNAPEMTSKQVRDYLDKRPLARDDRVWLLNQSKKIRRDSPRSEVA